MVDRYADTIFDSLLHVLGVSGAKQEARISAEQPVITSISSFVSNLMFFVIPIRREHGVPIPYPQSGFLNFFAKIIRIVLTDIHSRVGVW